MPYSPRKQSRKKNSRSSSYQVRRRATLKQVVERLDQLASQMEAVVDHIKPELKIEKSKIQLGKQMIELSELSTDPPSYEIKVGNFKSFKVEKSAEGFVIMDESATKESEKTDESGETESEKTDETTTDITTEAQTEEEGSSDDESSEESSDSNEASEDSEESTQDKEESGEETPKKEEESSSFL